ncbi:MAG: cupin domain-containing protein [Acidobacteriota bacterium]
MTKPIEKEQTEVWDVFGEKITCKVPGKDTFGRFAVVKEISPAKSAVPPHFHNETDEIIYILEGKYEFEIDGIITIAPRGEMLVIPRKTPHGFRNLLDTESKMLAIITPSGFEMFFAEVHKLKQVDIAKIVEIGKRNDLELVMCFL